MSDIIAADQLRLFIERIERLEEEKKGIADDIKDVYAEAKSNGYDTKTMRTIVRLRRMEKHHRDEAEMWLCSRLCFWLRGSSSASVPQGPGQPPSLPADVHAEARFHQIPHIFYIFIRRLVKNMSGPIG